MLKIFLIVFVGLFLLGCASRAVIDENDIEREPTKELQILDDKTIQKELKPSTLERIVPKDF